MSKYATARQERIQAMIGKRFGLWTVVSFSHFVKYPKCYLDYFNCRCDCGTEQVIPKGNLTRGLTKSCRCAQGEYLNASRPPKHGMSSSKEFRAYQKIIERCTNPKVRSYKDYGGRGITFCERWRGEQGFINFIADMGKSPSAKHSIDRIDNEGNYEPSNCRWATKSEQSRNRRSNRLLTFNGVEKLLVEWSEITKISEACITKRLSYGWTVEEALTRKVNPGQRRGTGVFNDLRTTIPGISKETAC